MISPWRKSAVRFRILVWMYAYDELASRRAMLTSNTYLGSFNMVMKIVSERLNVRDGVCTFLGEQVTWEKNFVRG